MKISGKEKSVLLGFKIALKTPAGFRGLDLALFLILVVLSGCASMQTPSGGPKDLNPPKILKESPKNLSTYFKAQQVSLTFDEFIKLNNAFSEITVSPALEKPLDVKSQKDLLEIKFDQALSPNTTYTINFGKAIGDVNENNLLKNYSYVFSTGAVLDSLSVSGSVKDAITNESLKDVTVFIWPVSQDSLFGKKKPSIYTQTDSAGSFKLKNLRADRYHVYALKETSADRIYNQGVDEIGFIDSVIDLKKNTSNLNFRIFKEEPAQIKITEKKIDADGRILLVLNKGAEKPSIKELGTENILKNSVLEFSAKNDSVSIWLPEITFDSLAVGLYSNGNLVDKATINRNKRETLNRTPIIKDNVLSGLLKPNSNLEFSISMPVTALDTSKVMLLSDSVNLKGWTVNKVAGSSRKYNLNYAFKPGKKYDIKIAPGAFTAISGLKNVAYSKTISAEPLDNYGNLSLSVVLGKTDRQYVLQLINEQKKVVREDVLTTNQTVIYTTYPTGKYTLRFVLDENRNGKWDTGNLAENKQPEKIWNYDKVIILRANWDLEEKITLPADL